MSENQRRALLVRVGIDSEYGNWNAPINPETGEYVYVPIPENRKSREGLTRPYEETLPAVERLADKYDKTVELPAKLLDRSMHLDPDFQHLSYGDVNARARQLTTLSKGDILVFYASFSPLPGMTPTYPKNCVYALIGIFHLAESPKIVMDSKTGAILDLPEEAFATNAHLRRDYSTDVMDNRRQDDGVAHPDVVVQADPEKSGRLTKALDIGIYRDRAYRVRKDILDAWGGLSIKDGYLQRSVNLPEFQDPDRFLNWFRAREPELVANNFGRTD